MSAVAHAVPLRRRARDAARRAAASTAPAGDPNPKMAPTDAGAWSFRRARVQSGAGGSLRAATARSSSRATAAHRASRGAPAAGASAAWSHQETRLADRAVLSARIASA